MIGSRVLIENRLPEVVANAIQGTQTDDFDRLARITLFARRVAPVITRAANEENAKLFSNGIPALAGELELRWGDGETIVELTRRIAARQPGLGEWLADPCWCIDGSQLR